MSGVSIRRYSEVTWSLSKGVKLNRAEQLAHLVMNVEVYSVAWRCSGYIRDLLVISLIELQKKEVWLLISIEQR